MNYRPELIVFAAADIVTTASIDRVKRIVPQAKMVQIIVDPLFSQGIIDRLRDKLPYMDATFANTAGSVLGTMGDAPGVVCHMPLPVDRSMGDPRCHERSDQENDVFWAVRLNPNTDLVKGNPRWEYPLYLEESGQVKIDYYGMNNKPTLWGAAYYQTIANAKMGLNINQGKLIRDYIDHPGHNSAYLYATDRIAVGTGSGLLMFCHRDGDLDSKMEDLFEEDKEIVFFSSREELLDKVKFYKKNDEQRREIARRGWEKSHNHLNERLVAQYIVEVACGKPFSEGYIWPTELY
jgi:hypothetical protein